MSKNPKTRFIDGPFYPWLIDMGNSEAMCRLRKSSDAVNVLTMFITKFSKQNNGHNLCITYAQAAPFMSTATFSKAKLRCQGFGFLYCRDYGRLERNASIYDLITKWQWLSRQPKKLDRIEHLLSRHERVLRIRGSTIRARIRSGERIEGKVRRKTFLHALEQRVIGVTNEP